MSTSGPICFWSYTHRDNDLEGGRIRRLAESIANEYELLTGEPLELFLDSSNIAWGDKWRDVINDALARTAFFIPVITPLYLKSTECRREFFEFSSRAKSIGAMDLLLPILYSEIPTIANGSTDDEIVLQVQTTQRADWRSLRLAEETSERYRSEVHDLAKRLVKVMDAESTRPLPESPEGSDTDDEPGLIEAIASAEENAESWKSTLEALWAELEIIQAITQDSTSQIPKSAGSRTARTRLAIIQRYAQDISEPSKRIDELGHEFFRAVNATDPGVRAIITQSKRGNMTPDEQAEAEALFTQVRDLATSTRKMADGVEEFLVEIREGYSLSRVLRQPLNQIRNGLKATADAHTVIAEWARLTTMDVA